MRDDKLLE
jgi:hypothetical protein